MKIVKFSNAALFELEVTFSTIISLVYLIGEPDSLIELGFKAAEWLMLDALNLSPNVPF